MWGWYSISRGRLSGARPGWLTHPTRSTGVYFNLLGLTLLHYSERWVVPLAGMAVLLFAGVTLLGRRRRQLTLVGIGLGFAATLLTALATVLFVTVAWWLSGPL